MPNNISTRTTTAGAISTAAKVPAPRLLRYIGIVKILAVLVLPAGIVGNSEDGADEKLSNSKKAYYAMADQMYIDSQSLGIENGSSITVLTVSVTP